MKINIIKIKLKENSYLNSWYNITKGFGEFFKERSADLEITPAEAMLLSKIYYKDGISQREIAHSLIVSEANITKTFKKLEGKELVYKTVDEDNNARRNLHLTEKGEGSTGYLADKLFKQFPPKKAFHEGLDNIFDVNLLHKNLLNNQK